MPDGFIWALNIFYFILFLFYFFLYYIITFYLILGFYLCLKGMRRIQVGPNDASAVFPATIGLSRATMNEFLAARDFSETIGLSRATMIKFLGARLGARDFFGFCVFFSSKNLYSN